MDLRPRFLQGDAGAHIPGVLIPISCVLEIFGHDAISEVQETHDARNIASPSFHDCYGLHMLHGVYPRRLASSSEIGMRLFDRALHPSLWYLVPLFVT